MKVRDYTAIPLLLLCLSGLAPAREGIEWTHLSSGNGDLPLPNGSDQQTTCVVADVDADGDFDFFITDRSVSPSVVLYRLGPTSWEKYVIHLERLPIEAGGAAADVDGDGDIDLALGQDGSGGNVWWWENPWPELEPSTPWDMRIIKTGGVEQHDQAFGDFDGDGETEFATWVNRRHRVEIYEIPADPHSASRWILSAEVSASGEGMDVLDVNGDGTLDIVAGGAWIRYEPDLGYLREVIDGDYAYCRITGADLIPGGRPEIVLNSGDERGPLNLYEYDGESWQETTLVADVDHGHSLEVGDIDGDGHIDIFAAEMGNPGAGSSAQAWIAWGDGSGSFELEVVTTGIGNHMSRLADVDGDGDLDIIMKPYSFGAPRVDVLLNNGTAVGHFDLDRWQRHLVDDSLPHRAVFVEAGDLDGDGRKDLAAGGWWWKQPAELAGPWTRAAIGPSFNNVALLHDFDGDGDLDLLGTQGEGSSSNHEFLWGENTGEGLFLLHANLATGGSGDFLQGREIAVFQGGVKQVALSWHNGGGGVQALTVPEDPQSEPWAFSTLSSTTQGEDLSQGDIDGDGDLDLLLGTQWLENDSERLFWLPHELGSVDDTGGVPDRSELADVDQDGDLDAVVGLEDGRAILWFENPGPAFPATVLWRRRTVGEVSGQGFSMDTGDLDGDGDPDVIVGEHRGSPSNRVIIFENVDHLENWPTYVVDEQPEDVADHHDGTQLVDMDGDGDLDVISVGWYNPKIWIYENLSTHEGVRRVATPVVRPAGGTYTGSVSVRITCATPDAEIRYTLDGTEPNDASRRYLGVVGLQEDVTLSARAFRAGWLPSDVATAEFNVEPDTAPPEVVSVISQEDPNRVRVLFNEPVDPASSQRGENYIIESDVEVLAAERQDDEKTVILTVSALVDGSEYFLKVRDVSDLASPPNSISRSSWLSFIHRTIPLVAYWPFDEGGGGTALDASGFRNDGSLEGPTYSLGRAGWCLRFDGSNDRVEIGNLDVPGDAMALTAWIRAERFDHLGSRDARVISKSTGVSEEDHYWMLSTIAQGTDTRLRFRLKAGGTTTTLIASSGSLSAGTWNHVAAVYDGRDMILYKDGVEVGRAAKTGLIETNPGVQAWIGGNPSGASDRPFDGRIDEVRIYRAALTTSQLRSVMEEADLNEEFQRGDTNGDGLVDLTDSIFMLQWLFLQGPAPLCLSAGDTNGDGDLDISDAIHLLLFRFLGGPSPAAPFPDCGSGTLPTDFLLGCREASDACR